MADAGTGSVVLAPTTPDHWPGVRAVWAAGIATGHATFEAAPPSWPEFAAAKLPALIASTEAAGIWTIQSGVFPENVASLALHRAAGFREVGVRERLGRMPAGPLAGRWRDVVLLERRSPRVGRN